MPRRSARVIVLDRTGKVLLFCVDDPESADPPSWITPGGAIEDGETLAEAACRELKEETGFVAAAEDLGPAVAMSEGAWEWRGKPVYSVDTYFALAVDAYEPDRIDETDLESQVISGHRWWSPDELAECPDDVFPLGLCELIRDLHAGRRPATPLRLQWKTV